MSDLKLQLIASLLNAKSNSKGLEEFKRVFNNEFVEFSKKFSFENMATTILKLQSIEKELELISAYSKLHTKNIIAVGGGFSAGKSEFISSFINENIKLPIGINPTTAIPTYVLNDSKNSIVGCSNKGGVVDLGAMDNEFYSKLSHEFIKSFGFKLKEIMPYLVISTDISYKNICFIDTPGYNPANSDLTNQDIEVAKEFLENSNLFLWLIGLDSNGTISLSDLDFLSSLNLENKKLFIVLNKADLKPFDDVEDIIDDVKEALEDEDIKIAGISAYSSILKKEFAYDGVSLFEFLEQNDIESTKHNDILEKIKDIYVECKANLQKKIKEYKAINKTLNSLSLDIAEDGIENEISYERIRKLKELFGVDKLELLLEELDKIIQELQNSIDMIFDKKSNVNFSGIEVRVELNFDKTVTKDEDDLDLADELIGKYL